MVVNQVVERMRSARFAGEPANNRDDDNDDDDDGAAEASEG